MNKVPYKGISGEELAKRMGMSEKSGKWVEVGSAFPRVRCSECGVVFQYSVQERDSCPMCGADMRERAVEGAGPYKEVEE